jgi:hypothetical protein
MIKKDRNGYCSYEARTLICSCIQANLLSKLIISNALVKNSIKANLFKGTAIYGKVVAW